MSGSARAVAVLTLVWLAAACGRAAPRPADPEAVFPHPSGYADRVHGVDAVVAGAACASCHVADDTGLSGGAPACRSCHAEYPHVRGMDAGATHAPLWESSGDRCAACHGADGSRPPSGLDRGRCTQCHSPYPHPGGWAERAVHGAAALVRGGSRACEGCHAADGSGPAEEGGCDTCHRAYPHSDDWASGANHGVAWRQPPTDGDPGCGISCHTEGQEDGLRRVACRSCHDLYPHPEGFADAHWVKVQARSPGTCLQCHAAGDAEGPTLPVGCAPACHAGGKP